LVNFYGRQILDGCALPRIPYTQSGEGSSIIVASYSEKLFEDSMKLSIEELRQPISEESPSGENLEYDPQYMEMETLFQTSGEASIEVEGQDDSGPDWKGIEKLSGELLTRTKDLRIQAYAALSSIYMHGLVEFRNNIEGLKVFLDEFWDSVHPQLDPDDDNDPMLRMNCMAVLNEYSLIAIALERVKLVEMKGIGKFGPRDAALAQGTVTPEEGEDVPDINLVRQAFITAEPEYLEELYAAVSGTIDLFAEIDSVWRDKTGEPTGPSFNVAEKALKGIAAVLNEFSPVEADNDLIGDEEGGDTEGGAARQAAISGAVNSRTDVIRVLDKCCDYYSAHEPSSPIPLLLRRAQRLVESSFMEILEDMVPDGVPQAKLVSGEKDEGY
jgi:type VI secretion system protein ImpA